MSPNKQAKGEHMLIWIESLAPINRASRKTDAFYTETKSMCIVVTVNAPLMSIKAFKISSSLAEMADQWPSRRWRGLGVRWVCLLWLPQLVTFISLSLLNAALDLGPQRSLLLCISHRNYVCTCQHCLSARILALSIHPALHATISANSLAGCPGARWHCTRKSSPGLH